MTDNELMELIRLTLLDQLALQGAPWDTVLVATSFQSAQEGRENGPIIYYFPLPSVRYGWQGRDGKYDPDEGNITYTERQWMQQTFQFSALLPQQATDTTIPTPHDLVSMAAMVMNSRGFIDKLRQGGAGVQRITDVRCPFFTNDQNQFEASPSFDFTVSNLRSIIRKDPATERFEFRQTRV
jgi:hypothetical protein